MSLPRLLALDAGGTSTRAVVVDAAGRAYGYGFASGGNPTAAGIREAAAAIGIAAEQALASSTSSDRPALALIAMAGEKTGAFRTEVSRRLAALGLRDRRPGTRPARCLPLRDCRAGWICPDRRDGNGRGADPRRQA